jgi:type III pantothenate kinase
MSEPHLHLLALAVGNTRTRVGLFHGRDLNDPVSIPNSDLAAIGNRIDELLENEHEVPIVVASVNNPVADKIEMLLKERSGENVYRIGRDLGIPMKHALDDDSTVGHDRLLNCLGAYSRAKQACIVIDAGTAITVDFVDGEGTFQGGVIAPGLNLMLKALHGNTAALPEIAFEMPDTSRGPFGKDTKHAMRLGVLNAARGVARMMIDLYADHYGAYPQIVATGGDAAALFSDDPVVEHIVSDLQLIGIREAAMKILGEESETDIELPDGDD